MSTLIRIPALHMRFVPAHKQTDEVTPNLSPAKWLVEFVLIANSKGRESFLNHERIHRILGPAIRDVGVLTQDQIRFFPSPPPTRGNFCGRLAPPLGDPAPSRRRPRPGTSLTIPPPLRGTSIQTRYTPTYRATGDWNLP